MLVRVFMTAFVVVIGIDVLDLSAQCDQCSTWSHPVHNGSDTYCIGSQTPQQTNHSKTYNLTESLACRNNGWIVVTGGSDSLVATGTGNCSPGQAVGSLPSCYPVFQPSLGACSGASQYFQVTVHSKSWGGSSCGTSGIENFYVNATSQGCMGTECCNKESDCRSSQGEFNPSDCSCTLQPSPIVIDLNGDGYRLTDAANGVSFDILGTGHAIRVSWIDALSDDAFLALDRDGDGRITSGRELFGNFTEQLPSESPNGFEALRLLDANADGWVTAADPAFAQLLLWTDSNSNGISEPSELRSLVDAGITAISLEYRASERRDPFGNRFRYRAKCIGPGGPFAYDVFLSLP